jgi:hypothetical protein
MENDVREPVRGWVSDLNIFGVRVAGRWVAWAIGAVPRPWTGEYAEVDVDPDGYARRVRVVAWRPTAPNPN